MSTLLLLTLVAVVISVQWVSADYGIDKTVCSPATQKVISPPPAITTGKLFSVAIEWRELISQRTYNVREYYDEERKLGSLYIQIPPQQNVKVIFDYNTDLALTIQLPSSQNAEATCSVSKIGPQMYRYADLPWLTSIMLVYRAMMASEDTRYVANSTVKAIRSYPVSEWSACMYDYFIDITSNTKMFFLNDSGQSWMTPHLPPAEPLPVQMTMHAKRHTNTSVQEYSVVGDFTDFTPFPVFPEDAFLTPSGVFCPGRPLTKELPPVSDQFYMLMEVIDMDLRKITFDEVWFDSINRRVRHDTKDSLGTDPNPLSYIYNFETGARYERDTYLGTCDVEPIRGGDEYTAVTVDNHITIQNASELFHYEQASIQYAGEMTTRGTLCDVWIGVYFDVDSNINATVQWYFAKKGWTQAVGTVVVTGSFYRMDLWRGGSTNPVIYNIHKYTPQAQHWAVFDCGECYKYNSKIHFVIQLLAMDHFTQHTVSESYLYDLMQDELTDLIYEEANRMSNIQVEFDGGNYLYVSGLLLDRTPVTNAQVANPVKQHPLLPAYSFLKGTVETQRLVLVTSVEGKPIRLKTERIQQISFPGDFSTVTTPTNPTTVFLIPTLPSNLPVPSPTSQEKTPQPINTPTGRPALTPRTTAPPIVHVTTSSSTPRPPSTTSKAVCSCPTCSCPTVTCPPRTSSPCPTVTTPQAVTAPPEPCLTQKLQTQAQHTQAGVSTGKAVCSCPTCSCPTVTCPPRTSSPCPTVTTPQAVTAPPEPCLTQKLQTQAQHTQAGVSTGAFGGAIIVSLILGAVLCLLVIVVTSRYRELPCIGQPHQDTETIPLDNYSTS